MPKGVVSLCETLKAWCWSKWSISRSDWCASRWLGGSSWRRAFFLRKVSRLFWVLFHLCAVETACFLFGLSNRGEIFDLLLSWLLHQKISLFSSFGLVLHLCAVKIVFFLFGLSNRGVFAPFLTAAPGDFPRLFFWFG